MLRAEPAFAVLRRDAGSVIVALTRNMVDAFARVDGDVPFDVAGRTEKRGGGVLERASISEIGCPSPHCAAKHQDDRNC